MAESSFKGYVVAVRDAGKEVSERLPITAAVTYDSERDTVTMFLVEPREVSVAINGGTRLELRSLDDASIAQWELPRGAAPDDRFLLSAGLFFDAT